VALGFIYEVYGRKPVMLICLVLAVLMLFWMPLTSPNLMLFGLAHIVNALSLTPVISAPLILDYIEVESRGKVIGLTIAAFALGGLLS
jgi:MFS family permease